MRLHPRLFLSAFGLLPSALAVAGMVGLTLGFESDPLGAPPLWAALSTKGCAYMTNSPVCSGKQSLAVVSTGQVALVDWSSGVYIPFGWWSAQGGNLPIQFKVAACAAQTNARLNLLVGRDSQNTAAHLQFAPGGSLVAVTAEGAKPLTPYTTNTWYVFDIRLWTSNPRYQVTVLDTKGTPLATATNLLWAQPALTNNVLLGFAFSVQGTGAFFVDDIFAREVEPVEEKPWPRKLVVYPK